MDLLEYRSGAAEQERSADLLRLLPSFGQSVLDIGARDGYFSRLLAQRYREVVALDIDQPAWSVPGVRTVQGDVTALEFPDNSFDCVFCAEVLEHIPALEKACSEILRVARQDIVIGVPFKQDRRIGQMTCSACGRVTPSWGHVNDFDQAKLQDLFSRAAVVEVSFVGRSRAATNAVAASLMTAGGNPWGTYEQEEACVFCQAKLKAPSAARPLLQKICSAVALRLQQWQSRFTPEHGNWIHVRFQKNAANNPS